MGLPQEHEPGFSGARRRLLFILRSRDGSFRTKSLARFAWQRSSRLSMAPIEFVEEYGRHGMVISSGLTASQLFRRLGAEL